MTPEDFVQASMMTLGEKPAIIIGYGSNHVQQTLMGLYNLVVVVSGCGDAHRRVNTVRRRSVEFCV
ncbi:MAG: hypothetical protein ACRDWH_01280 [Acidimicrobiia bacterium]